MSAETGLRTSFSRHVQSCVRPTVQFSGGFDRFPADKCFLACYETCPLEACPSDMFSRLYDSPDTSSRPKALACVKVIRRMRGSIDLPGSPRHRRGHVTAYPVRGEFGLMVCTAIRPNDPIGQIRWCVRGLRLILPKTCLCVNSNS